MAYDIDPSLADVPIHTSELEQILVESTKDVLKDQRKFAHLMGRVLTTLRLRSETIHELNREIGQMRTQAEQVGRASTLNPVDQVRYLSDEQKAQLFGKMQQERLAAMDREVQKAQTATRAATQILSRAKYALLALAEDPTMPLAVRQRVQEVLSSIEPVGPGSAQGPSSSGTGWQTATGAQPTTASQGVASVASPGTAPAAPFNVPPSHAPAPSAENGWPTA